MGLLRILALGAAGAVAYTLWKQRQAQSAPRAVYDDHGLTPPHGDPLIGAATASWDEPEPPVAASQSSRGFGRY